MSELIRPEELPHWVPGELTLDSAPLGWNGVRVRGYRYSGSDVPVPAMQDYMIVVYKDGATPMFRRCGGAWRNETCGPGSASLLTHAARSHWRWSEPIEVSHLYLSPKAVAVVAAEVFDRDIEDVELMDVLRIEDPVLNHLANALVYEANEKGLGGSLYVDAIRTQACVHILRNYASVIFRDPNTKGGLTPSQKTLIQHYIDDNVHRNIGLAELANLVRLSSYHFARKFRGEFGCPPHAYVIQRRLEHAKRQLARSTLPLKCVAANSGFADQSHMTRLFRQLLGCTPAEYRDIVGSARSTIVLATRADKA